MECDQEIIPSGGQSLRHLERQPSTALVGPDHGVTETPRHRAFIWIGCGASLYGSRASSRSDRTLSPRAHIALSRPIDDDTSYPWTSPFDRKVAALDSLSAQGR